jgi:precorrin-6A synthase
VRRLLVIGIGAGDPDHLTVEAVKALELVDVFFVIEKRGAAADLTNARRAILERYADGSRHRVVAVADPERARGSAASREGVQDWRLRRADAWERAIREELGEEECGAFLVWGDPSLYDSTLDVIEQIRDRGELAFEHRVIPGITSVQALAARHRAPLNRVGGAVQIMPARLLADGWPDGVDDLVVMLDSGCAFRQLDPEGVVIQWGAYVGTEEEILIAGPLAEVGEEIERVRAEARERVGWIMDSYLLHRSR